MHRLNDILTNGLYDIYLNCLDVLPINIFPYDVRSLHELSVTVLKRLPVNVCCSEVKESVDVTSESDRPGMNGLGLELTLNCLNGINGLMQK